MIEKVSLKSIKCKEDNPRHITELKFEKLKQSIIDFPEMLDVRPLIVDENGIILGGNMRYRACEALGLKEVSIIRVENLTQDQKRQFVVKDNVSYGAWDYDILTSEYDAIELDKMGLDLDPNMFRTPDPDEYEKQEDVKFNDYTIYFANEEEMEFFYGFLKKLKNKFSDYDNVGERVLMYIADVYGENKMKESEMILRFLKNG